MANAGSPAKGLRPSGFSLDGLISNFREFFNAEPTIISYAPGRVEVLGNHTDYNEGYVLSAAIQSGTYFLLIPTTDDRIEIHSGHFEQTATFSVKDMVEEAAGTVVHPVHNQDWANYVKGVLIGVCLLLSSSCPPQHIVSWCPSTHTT
eukprot:TRINITY_DN868_c0_g1_i2.p1 TRINITY_DN868_c0_g1~~TRINITY_DN868_c0_g1_i2.p1  ORF type:complete len:148 (-),score=12.54 TRINITY_DN868_c0_g1_i2:271-714(-)